MKTKTEIQEELDLVFGKGTKNISKNLKRIRKIPKERKNKFVEDFNYYQKLASLNGSETAKTLLKNAAERLSFTPKQLRQVSFIALQLNSLEKPVKSRLSAILTIATAKAIQLATFLIVKEKFTDLESKNDFKDFVSEKWYGEIQKISDNVLPKNPSLIINKLDLENKKPIITPKKNIKKPVKRKKTKLKRITKKEITDAFLKRPSTKIFSNGVKFFS